MPPIPVPRGFDRQGGYHGREQERPGQQEGETPVPDVSVILPTLNERQNIPSLLAELRDLFRSRNYRYELLVVDDASKDGTPEAAARACEGDPGFVLVERNSNPGLAFSIREGIERSRGAVVLVMDTDFNHRPADALLLFEVARHVDLAIGSRFIFGGGMPNLLRYYLSYLYNLFLRLLLGTRMDENLSGFFAIRRECLLQLDFDKIFWGYGDYFFRLLLLSQRKGFLHVELPVYYGLRLSGEPKTRFLGIFTSYTREVIYILYLKMLRRW